MQRTRGFGDTNPGREKAKRPDEIVDFVDLDTSFTALRLVGSVYGYAQHWIEIEVARGVINIPKVAINYDPETDTFDDTIEDPYTELPNKKQTSKVYYVNAIVRDLQDNEPRRKGRPSPTERKTGIVDKNSKTWTPVRVLRVPTSMARDLQRLITMNKHKVRGRIQEFELSDPKYGCDIFVSYDPNAAGTSKYSVQKGDAAPLTKDEEKYLQWDLSNLMQKESLLEAQKEAKALAAKAPDAADDEEDEDEEDDNDALSRRKSKSRSRSRSSTRSRSSDNEPKTRDRKRVRSRSSSSSSKSSSKEKPERGSKRSSTKTKTKRTRRTSI